MYRLSEKQAQDIVDKMMLDIPYNINIMNEQGVIIGSGSTHRIGTIHPGAVEALATGQRIEVWQDGRLEQKGTNEPIVIDGQYIGVIGITGEPDEVRPFCNLVRTTVSLLIEQRSRLESLAHEASRKKAFLDTLLEYRGSSYPQKLRREASVYQLDLLLQTAVLYIHGLQLNEHTGRLLLLFPSFRIHEQQGSFVVMIQNQEELLPIMQRFLQDQPEAFIAAGRLDSSIANSYLQARDTMQILLALRLPSRTACYDDVQFLVRFSQAPLSPLSNAAARLEDTADLLDTLRSFIFHNGSIHDTALDLNIHRNTLQYRLKRIHTLTGKDPRHLLELIELTHGLLSMHF